MANTHNIIFDIILLSSILEMILVAAQTNELRCQCSCTSMKNPEVIMYASGNLHQKGNLGLMDSLNVKSDASANIKKKISNQIKTGRSRDESQGGSVYDTSAYAVNENNSVTLNLQMVNSNEKEKYAQTSENKTTSNNKPSGKTKKGLTLRSLNELLKAATSQLLAVFSKQSAAAKSNKVVSQKQSSTTTTITDKSKTNIVVPKPKTFVTDTVISGSEGLSGILQPSLNRIGKTKSLQKTERTVKFEEVTNNTKTSVGTNSAVKSMQGVQVDGYSQLNGNKVTGSSVVESEWITSKPEVYVHPKAQNIIVPENNIILPSLGQTSKRNEKTNYMQENTAFQDMSLQSKTTDADKIDIYIPPESAMSHLDKMLQTKSPIDFGSSVNQLSDQIAGGSLSPQNPTTGNLGSVKTSSYVPSHADTYNPIEGNDSVFNVQKSSSVPSAKINVGNLGPGPRSESNSKSGSKSIISTTMELGSSQYKTELSVKPDVYQPSVVRSTSETATGIAQPDVYIPPIGGSRTDTSLTAQANVYTSLVGDTVSTNVNADLYNPNGRGKATRLTTPQTNIYVPVVKESAPSISPPADIYIPVVGASAPGPITPQPDIYVPVVRGSTPSISPPADIYIPVVGASAPGPTTPQPDIFARVVRGSTPSTLPQADIYIPAFGASASRTTTPHPDVYTTPHPDVYVPPAGVNVLGMSSTDKSARTQEAGLGDHIFGTLLGTNKGQTDSSNTIPNGRTDSPLNVYQPPKVIGTSYIETLNKVSKADTTLGGNLQVGLSTQDLSGQGSVSQSDMYVPSSDKAQVQIVQNSLTETASQNANNKANTYKEQIIPLWITSTTKSPVFSKSDRKAPPSWIMDTTQSPAADPWNQVRDKVPPSWIADTTAAPAVTQNNIDIVGKEQNSWFLDTSVQPSTSDTASNKKKNPPSWITDTVGSTQQNVGNSQLWNDGSNKISITQQDQLGQSSLQIDTQPSSSVPAKQDVPSWLSDMSSSKPNLQTVQSQSTQTSGGFVDQSSSAKQTNTITEDWAALLKKHGLTTDSYIAQPSSSSTSSGNAAKQSKVTFENVDWNSLISQLKNDGQSAINSNLQSGDVGGQSKKLSSKKPIVSRQGISKGNKNEVNMQELTSLFENYVKNFRSSNKVQKKPKPKPSTPSPTQMSQNEQFALAMMFGSMIN